MEKEDEISANLYKCVFEGDIKGFREIWLSNQEDLDINQPLKTFDWNPLMFACQVRVKFDETCQTEDNFLQKFPFVF